ncbi:MAG: amidohydrolase family protein [Synergistaceae bacterium]|nr:amidohydrolase family protein [Synergistaceae bacterium]
MPGQEFLVRGWTDTGSGPWQVGVIADREKGTILRVGPADEIVDLPGREKAEYGASLRILPGDVNAHSHPEQSLYTGLVDPSWDLPTWCRNTIYRHSVELAPEHVYLGCCRAFAHMLLLGVTTAAVSFYCHNRRKNELDREVIRAAKDTGIRLYFGRMHYDLVSPEAYPEKRASQESYFETIPEYEAGFRELFAEVGCDLLVAVAPALHSFHANTLEAVASGIRLGEETDRLVQFHLSEDRGDVSLCLGQFGMRPVEVLDALVRSGRVAGLSVLLASDGIWTNDREKALMALHGIRLVLNPRMNRRVKAGRADLPAYMERKIPLFLGTDGEASNEDLSIEGERRFLAEAFPDVDPAAIQDLGRGDFPFPHCPVGRLVPGAGADLKIVGPSGVRDVYVGGNLVVQNGRLLKLDLSRDVETPLKALLSDW